MAGRRDVVAAPAPTCRDPLRTVMRDIVKSALAKAQLAAAGGAATAGGAVHPVWSELVSGQRRCNLQFLAGKILLRRLEQAVRENPLPGHVAACARELHALYANNRNIPAARNDVKVIMAQEEGGERRRRAK